MILKDFLESIEPGGPPYGVMYGSSIKFEDAIKRIPDFLEQNPGVNILIETGDFVQGLNS